VATLSEVTAVRTNKSRLEKLDRLAAQRGISRNKLWNLLVDEAAAGSGIVVNLAAKKSDRSAKTLAGERTVVDGAK